MSVLSEYLGHDPVTPVRFAPPESESRGFRGRPSDRTGRARTEPDSREEDDEPPGFIIRLFINLGAWLVENFGDLEIERHEQQQKDRKAPPPGGIRGEVTPRDRPVASNFTAGIRVSVAANGVGRQIEDAVRRALADSAVVLQDELRSRLGERTGPAPPGFPPGVASGRLADSISVEFDSDGLGVIVGTDAPYAWYLEFGTAAMPARPFLHPTFERFEHKILARVREEVLAALRRNGVNVGV